MNSILHDETTFYQAFLTDLKKCKREIIIESPFITTARMKTFNPIFKRLITQGVKIYVITRHPKEHSGDYKAQSEAAISFFEKIGVQPLLCLGNHHRKLAILDRKVLWEGSLNILSQTKSREIMRKIDKENYALEMFTFLKLDIVIK
ncbi:MAG TPA: phospholipase D-like domain-containing protein [Candidatus Saccharimonadales bacterium]|nr:phospholipase D-like domain-containing protein [Candidatus Saccharimonadales bacterium]